MKRWVPVPLMGLVCAALVSAGPASGVPPVRSEDHFLCMVLLKAQTRVDRIRADIGKAEEESRTNAQAIQAADRRLTIAMETQNWQAADAPKKDLEKARAERRRIRKALDKLESDQARAADIYAAVRSVLVANKDRAPSSLPIGLVSASSGNPGITKADGKKIAAAGAQPRFLDAGDTVSTGRNGRAEVLAFDGRGSIDVEEESQVRLEAPSAQEQVLALLQGRIEAAVDKPADLERQLQDRLRGPEDELSGLLRDYRGLAGQDFARLFGPDFMMRVPGAVCTAAGALFTAEIKPDGTTEIQVQDGSIEVRGLSSASLVVDRGSAVVVTKEGLATLRPPKR